ncbi:MAG: hypothetical protein Q9208_008342 [Pyrenodesmia sp. 3 TL-2023]
MPATPLVETVADAVASLACKAVEQALQDPSFDDLVHAAIARIEVQQRHGLPLSSAPGSPTPDGENQARQGLRKSPGLSPSSARRTSTPNNENQAIQEPREQHGLAPSSARGAATHYSLDYIDDLLPSDPPSWQTSPQLSLSENSTGHLVPRSSLTRKRKVTESRRTPTGTEPSERTTRATGASNPRKKAKLTVGGGAHASSSLEPGNRQGSFPGPITQDGESRAGPQARSGSKR